MLTTRLSTPAALLAMCGLGGLAMAAPPAVLDYVPSDAPIVLTVANLGELMADVTRVNTALGDQGNMMVPMMMGMMGGLPGVDLTGSMAIVINSADFENLDPSAVSMILPIADMDALVEAMQGRVENGVVLLSMQGQELALKSLGGGFAVAGQSADAVRGFAGNAGHLAANQARLGASGTELVSGGDVTLMVNIQALRPMIEPQLEGMMEQAEMMAAGNPAGGELPAEAMQAAIERFLAEASMGVVSVSADELGVGLNVATQFRAETELANLFGAEANAHELLKRVPGGAYYFAGAADLSWPGFETLVEVATNAIAQAQEAQPDAAGMMSNMGNIDLAAMLENAQGYAQVVSVNPAGMQAGLLKNSATYIASTDAAGLVEMHKQTNQAADGSAGGGISIASFYEAGATTIGGVELDAYGTTFSADQNSMVGGASPAMMMQMFFGPDMGPKGYVGRLENGMMQTTTQDEAFVTKAIDAAKNGNGLGADEGVSEIADRLPSGRFFELFIGTDHLLNNVAPMLAMFGLIDGFEPTGDMPPMAAGLSGHSGGFNFGLFIPLEVIEVGAEMAPDEPTPDTGANEDPEF
ncbi:MAG: hypothetical protein ACI89L_001824 [Phycisphaerales bacterium]|jgi:hypothetical protein